jgi:O-methyltransferase
MKQYTKFQRKLRRLPLVVKSLGNLKYERIWRRYRDFTMIPRIVYEENLRLCEEFGPDQGCIVECGVWRGGMSAGIADVLPGRNHLLFDSFEGLPPAETVDGEAALLYQREKNAPHYFDNCRAEKSFAERAMAMSRARAVSLIQGWFKDTVSSYSLPEPIAVLRLDGDWYESTIICLRMLMPKVVAGGLVIVDDYFFWDGCARAVHDYLSETKGSERIERATTLRGHVCYFTRRAN